MPTQTLPQITAQDKAFFDRHGYWFSSVIIEPHELQALAAAQDAIHEGVHETGEPPVDCYWKQEDGPTKLRKFDDTHVSSRAVAAIVRDPRIGSITARLLGADAIRLWHDQFLYKPPGGKAEGNVAWHQDYNYWHASDRPDMITAWVPLHDVDLEIGTMCFLDASHRWGWKKEFSHGFNGDLERQERVIRQHMPPDAEFNIVPVVLKAGQVSFHHCLTLHGSGPNRTDRPRRSLVLHLQSGECRWRSHEWWDWHLCARKMKELGRSPGQTFEGRYWPMLWPESA